MPAGTSSRGDQLDGRFEQFDHVPVLGSHDVSAADQADPFAEPFLDQKGHGPAGGDGIGIRVVVRDDEDLFEGRQDLQQALGRR